MDPALRMHLDEHLGVVSSRAARRLGLTPNELRRLVARESLVRVTRGVYVDAALLRDGSPENHHRVRTQAIVLGSHGRLAASHHSGSVLHDLPVQRRHLDRVRVVHTDATDNTRRHDAFTVHRCPGSDALGTVGAVASVIPAVAVVGTAMLDGIESGLMAADAALHREVTSIAELQRWVERARGHPGVSRAAQVVELASPLAESPGESLLRLVLLRLGYEVIAQHRVRDATGRVIARVDFFLPALGVVVEFDGFVKYAGRAGAGALAAEKVREDQIRARGLGVARIVWDDLHRPLLIGAKIRAAAASLRR